MTAIPHKPYLIFAALLMLASITAAAVAGNALIFLVPVILVMSILLLQHPEWILYLLAALIPWSFEYNLTDALATDLPDEPLMLLGSLAALLLIVYQRKQSAAKIHFLTLIIALQFLWMLATVFTSTAFIFSIKFGLAKTWYLLAFFVLPLLLGSVHVMKRSAFVLACSTLLVTLVILVRHAIAGFEFAAINDAVSPFFRNHVVYSALLVFTIPVWMIGYRSTQNKSLKILFVLVILIAVAALYLSYSRGAWLALLAGIAAVWLIRKKLLFKTFLVFLFLTVVAVFWIRQDDRYLQYAHDYQTTVFHEDFSEHLAATYQGKDVSTAERFYRWIAGLRMVEDYWMTGSGPTSFYPLYKEYTIPLFRTWVSGNEERSTVHNYFLLVLIEQGIIGLLLLLLLVGSMFWYAEKLFHGRSEKQDRFFAAAIAVILVMQCVVNFLSDLVETDKAGSVFYLSLGFLVLLSKKSAIDPKTN